MSLSDFFKKRIEDRDYSDLQKSLRRIRVARSPHDYVAKAILYSTIIAIVVASVCFSLFFFLFSLYLPYSIGLSVGVGGGLGFAVYFVFISYPQMKASNREKEIEDMLPHAVAYMLALSKGGFEPIEIFESLSDQEEYGEIAREAGAIVRDSKVLGYSPTEAIEDVAETTPSEEFRDFLASLSSVIETGASIPDFLHRRTERYYREAEEKQEEDLEFLGVLSEVYVTSLGLGPIFGIVIIILFGMMGNFMTSLLYIIVYLLIPLGTGMFILILDMQSRTQFARTNIESGGDESSGMSFFDSINQKLNHSKDRLKNIRGFLDPPMNVLWLTVPIGVLVSAALFFRLGVRIESAITFFALISLTPLTVLFERERRKRERMIEITPDFLNSFSDSLTSGLSPSKAIFSLTPERYGELESEIEKIRRDIEWGDSVSESFRKATDRLGRGIISRIMSLVRKSSEVASDISGILEVLAEDVTTERSLQQERSRVTSTYVIVVFLSFGIFLLTAYSLSASFIPLMTKMSESQVSGETPVAQFGGISPTVIKQIFFHASLIQGFCSGLLAGMMEKGKLSAGLKYSLIMLSVAWVFFTFLVM